MAIKHRFHSGKGDGGDSTVVKPSNWNDDHDFITVNAGVVIGRDTSAAGQVQELPLAIDPDGTVHLGGDAFVPPSGGTGDRPPTASNGSVRFNTDTGKLEAYIGGVWLEITVGGGSVPVGGTVGWYSNTLPAGYLFCNGQTIGSAASAADQKNDLYQALFVFIYTNLTNMVVTPGGRGASAGADWAANKAITLPDERGAVSAGSDVMGATPAALPVLAAAWAAGVITVTATNHLLKVGQAVVMAGMTPAGYNGTFVVASAPSASTFTYARAADPGAATVMGTATNGGFFNKTVNPLGPNGAILADIGGESLHQLINNEMPVHSHPSGMFPGGAAILQTGGATQMPSQVSTGSAGGDLPHNNVQRTNIKNVIIKY